MLNDNTNRIMQDLKKWLGEEWERMTANCVVVEEEWDAV